MRTLPSEEEVRVRLELGLSYLPEGPSQEWIKDPRPRDVGVRVPGAWVHR